MRSLLRCLNHEDFLKSFYARFLNSSDEIAEKFKHTDFAKQEHLLAESLKITAAATEGDISALKELRQLAGTHDHAHLDIRPELYAYWRAALIETAIRYDPEWDIQTHVTWDHILGNVIQHMTKHY